MDVISRFLKIPATCSSSTILKADIPLPLSSHLLDLLKGHTYYILLAVYHQRVHIYRLISHSRASFQHGCRYQQHGCGSHRCLGRRRSAEGVCVCVCGIMCLYYEHSLEYLGTYTSRMSHFQIRVAPANRPVNLIHPAAHSRRRYRHRDPARRFQRIRALCGDAGVGWVRVR